MAKKRPLSDQQERFCHEYIIDLNATQAATRAGYAKRSAGQHAFKLLKNDQVQKLIQQLQAERAVRTDTEADKVIQEIKLIAFSQIGDYLTFSKSGVILKASETIPIEKQRAIAYVQEVTTEKGGRLAFKLHSKTTALDLLCRHLGLLEPDTNITIKVPRVRFFRHSKGKSK